MPSTSTDYRPDSVINKATLGGGSGDLMGLLKALLMRKLATPNRMRPPGMGASSNYNTNMSGAGLSGEGTPVSQLQKKLLELEVRDRENMLAAKQQAPMRKMGWMGPEFYDPMGMNAYEKELYLPDQASFMVNPEEEAGAKLDYATGLADDQERRDNWDRTGAPGTAGALGTSALEQRIRELEAALRSKK